MKYTAIIENGLNAYGTLNAKNSKEICHKVIKIKFKKKKVFRLSQGPTIQQVRFPYRKCGQCAIV